MKKYLPISSGFTLIELMVVVAIIAILALVSLGIFNGAQGNARDGRRLAEVNALAKNIESTKDPVTGKYSYSDVTFGVDYPNSTMLDPDGVSTYCVYMSDSPITAPTSNPTGSSGFLCPTIVQTATKGGGATAQYVAMTKTATATFSVGPNLYFSVCSVRSERGSKPICQSQFTR